MKLLENDLSKLILFYIPASLKKKGKLQKNILQRERDKAYEIAASFNNDCSDIQLRLAWKTALTKSGYGSRKEDNTRTRLRNRHMIQAISKFCPPTLSYKSFFNYIEGDNLFSIEQISNGLTCSNKELFYTGSKLRDYQAQTFRDYRVQNKMRAIAMLNDKELGLNERYNLEDEIVKKFNNEYLAKRLRIEQVKKAIEDKCKLPMTFDSDAEKSYYGVPPHSSF